MAPRTSTLLMAAVGGLTLLGFALRLADFNQSLFADELSTYWIVHGRSLGSVVSHVRSNDEITPPLFFVLGWLTLKLGSAPEWVRLPSLIAGTLSIPLIYALGVRTVGRLAGLLGAAIMALSPFMIYYSTEARSYAVMIALLIGSTLALLAAVRGGGARWWAVYALCSCATLYSHYTAVFALAAQFLWVLWAHRETLRPLLVANVAVLVGFAPWIPGFIADNNSPTTDLLSRLQPFTLDAVTRAFENWSVGYPYSSVDTLPGALAWSLIAAGVLVAATACAVRGWRWLRGPTAGVRRAARRAPSGVVLIAMLALATPVGEAIVSAIGPTQVLGARNLNASWPGLALGIGALVTAAGGPLAVACAGLILAGFTIGAVKALGSDGTRPQYAAAAHAIESRWSPGDVVVDGAPFTPVPLTGLDVYLPQTHPEIRLGLPISTHPFKLGDPKPSLSAQIDEALRRARGRRMFLVASVPRGRLGNGTQRQVAVVEQRSATASGLLRRLPPGLEVVRSQVLPGLTPFVVFTIQASGRR